MTWRPFLFVASGFAGAIAVLCVELSIAAVRVPGAVMDGTSRAVLILFYFPMLLVALGVSAMFLEPIIEHSTRSEHSVAVRSLFLICTQVTWIASVSCFALAALGEVDESTIYSITCRVTIPLIVAATVMSAIGIREMRKLGHMCDTLQASSESIRSTG